MYKRLGAVTAVVCSVRGDTPPPLVDAVYDSLPTRENKPCLRRLVLNDFQPIPMSTAPWHVHVAFTHARRHVPADTSMTPLVTGGRCFSTFNGSPREFLRRVSDGPVMVFFFKPACAPCATIRSKIADVISPQLTSTAVATASEAFPGCPPQATAGEAPSVDITVKLPDMATGQGIKTDRTPFEGLDSTVSQTEMTAEDAAACHSAETMVAKEYPDASRAIEFLAVNTNDNGVLTALHDVRSLPTFVAYVHGRILGRVEGALEADLVSLVEAQARKAREAPAPGAFPPKTDDPIGPTP